MNIRSRVLPYLCISLFSLLTACGGAATDDKEEPITTSPDENPPPIENETEPTENLTVPNEEEGELREGEPNPTEEEQETIEVPIVLLDDEPIIAEPLNDLTVAVNRNNNSLTVIWSDANAASYRVLFWQEDGTLSEWLTDANSQVITTPHSIIAGQIIVEAYDALGNSVFSTPVSMEAL